MNRMERAAQEHARDELHYRASTRAIADMANDKSAREKADRKIGHSPKCSLTKCHPECSSHGDE